MAALAKALNALSFGVQEVAAQGSGVNDTELCEVLVDLDISPGKPADLPGKARRQGRDGHGQGMGDSGGRGGYCTGYSTG